MRVLDLGAGSSKNAEKMYAGSDIVTVDLDPETNPTVLADVRELPDDLGTFDVILASHVLEHLYRPEVLPALEHWREYLVPGGLLVVLVPDIYWAAHKIVNEDPDYLLWLSQFYGQETDLLVHRMGFTVALLRSVVEKAGYLVREATVRPYTLTMSDREEPATAMQIVVMANKPMEETHGV